MKTKHLPLLTAGLLVAGNLSANINIDTVLVGNADNSPDTPFNDPFGAVSYEYYIGKKEVTNSEYTTFLNSAAKTDTHSLYNTSMANETYGGITRSGSSGNFIYDTVANRENNPVNYVSFWDAARFANWLTTGNTETGVYNLGGVTNPTNSGILRNDTAWVNNGVAIASDDEWYKAAYHQPAAASGDTDDYWQYATASNNIGWDDANYGFNLEEPIAVGSYDAGYYGTLDQGGNVEEWNDEISSDGEERGVRGGHFNSFDSDLEAGFYDSGSPTDEFSSRGFRVTSLAAIPEPSFVGGLIGAVALLMAWRRRDCRTL